MFPTKYVKLKTILCLTSALVGVMAFPEAGHGAQGVLQRQLQESKQKEAVLTAQVAAAGVGALALEKQKKAMSRPDEALNGGGAFGNNLLAALDVAASDAASAANIGRNTANLGERITALRVIEGAIGHVGAHANDTNTHIPAVKAALGLTGLPDADVKAFLVRLANAAEAEHVHLPEQRGLAGSRQLQAAAMSHPDNALNGAGAFGGALLTALDAAASDAASAANIGRNTANLGERITALRVIEGAIGHVGAHANDVNTHIPAVKAALGLTGLPDAQVKAFLARLADTAAGDAIFAEIRAKLTAGTVQHLRQIRAGVGGSFGLGPLGPFVGATKEETIKKLGQALWYTFTEEESNGHHPTRAEVEHWLQTEFGVP